MLLIRGIAIIVGLGAIAAVTHGTIMATGGYGLDTNAPMLIALALVQAVLAMTIGDCFAKRRRALASLAILVLVACEICSFIATANLQLGSIETHAAPIRDAEAKHKDALARLAAAENSTGCAGCRSSLGPHAKRGHAQRAKANPAIRCAKPRSRLRSRSASAAVDDARAAVQLEKAQARAALKDAPLPGSATPLADRLGVQPSTLDLLYVGFRGFAVAAGAAIVLAYGVHGRRRPSEGVLVEVERRPLPKSAPEKKRLQIQERPTAEREADSFAKAMFRPEPDGRVTLRDIREAYHSWCASTKRSPLPDKEIAVALNELFSSVGLLVEGQGANAAIVGIGWRNKQLAA